MAFNSSVTFTFKKGLRLAVGLTVFLLMFSSVKIITLRHSVGIHI